ncbi:MAG: hypothetical protein R2690_20180 [Acidimicrobiales bacterium]
MTAARTRTPLRRDAIVEEARVLIARDGLDALTLRRLADSFSVSAPGPLRPLPRQGGPAPLSPSASSRS